MKIVVLDGYTENPGDLSWDEMKKYGELTVYDRTPAEEVVNRIGNAEVVFTNKTPITKETMDACPDFKFISVLATGYNVIDVNYAKEKGIVVSNIPTYGTDCVGQFAIALLLEICHRIGHHDKAVKEGRWENAPDWCFWDYPLIELAGKTLGIIGFGRDNGVARFLVLLPDEVGAHQEEDSEGHEEDGHGNTAPEDAQRHNGAGREGRKRGQEPAADDGNDAGDAVHGALAVPCAVSKGRSHGHHERNVGGGKRKFQGCGGRDEDAGHHEVNAGAQLIEGELAAFAVEQMVGFPHAVSDGGKHAGGHDLLEYLPRGKAAAHDGPSGQRGRELFFLAGARGQIDRGPSSRTTVSES